MSDEDTYRAMRRAGIPGGKTLWLLKTLMPHKDNGMKSQPLFIPKEEWAKMTSDQQAAIRAGFSADAQPVIVPPPSRGSR